MSEIITVKDARIWASEKGDRPCSVQIEDKDGDYLDIEVFGDKLVFRAWARAHPMGSPALNKEVIRKAFELLKERCEYTI